MEKRADDDCRMCCEEGPTDGLKAAAPETRNRAERTAELVNFILNIYASGSIAKPKLSDRGETQATQYATANVMERTTTMEPLEGTNQQKARRKTTHAVANVSRAGPN